MAHPPTVNSIALRLPVDSLAAGAATTTGTAAPRWHEVAGMADMVTAGEPEASAAIGELVDALRTTSIGLRFEIDETTHRIITKVVDKGTGELIRQMPTEAVLRIAHAIDKLQGLFVSQAA
ncbi:MULTISPECIES: flagellar protein FlaG [unclassified Cupriavidus]|uniref:flagellar protein FlaG n=1 Tax=unclassified Cupriavidus TaxID=2640874 RepID=UPI00048B7CA0|nr:MULTISPECIES: flagellar protein FlaG [unclassified Cupriavidus]MBP0636502.1 flagellar protein FlaG [Cupriavidus sp. AcVe19-6a]